MAAITKRKLGIPDILKQHEAMQNEHGHLLAWTRELEAEGRMREAASTFEAAEEMQLRIEEFERTFHFSAVRVLVNG